MSSFKEGENLNQHLIQLWKMKNQAKSIKIMCDNFQISEKQMRRWLQKWQAKGFIVYSPGSGRGNFSTIQWLIDIESELLIQLKNDFQANEYKLLETVKNGGFSSDFYKEVSNLLFKSFQVNQNSEHHVLRFPIFQNSLNLNPLTFQDAESGYVIHHLYSRLIRRDHQQGFKGDLVHHWEIDGDTYTFYLRRNCKWHDGTTLRGEEILESLNRNFATPIYKRMKDKINEIRLIQPFIFQVEYYGLEEDLLNAFAKLEMSIYKETPTGLVGTGPFILSEQSSYMTVLVANEQYYSSAALIDQVQFIQIPASLPREYIVNSNKNSSMLEVSEYVGDVTAYLNCNSPTFSKSIKWRRIIGYLLEQFKQELSSISHKKIPMRTFLEDTIPPDEFVAFSKALMKPLKIAYFVNQKKFVEKVVEVFKDYRIPVVVTHLKVEGDVSIINVYTEHDVLIFGESFYVNEKVDSVFNLSNEQHPLYVLYKELNMTNNESLVNPLEYLKRVYWVSQLYQSHRVVYYPQSFRLSNVKIFGYPCLVKSWIGIEQ